MTEQGGDAGDHGGDRGLAEGALRHAGMQELGHFQHGRAEDDGGCDQEGKMRGTLMVDATQQRRPR